MKSLLPKRDILNSLRLKRIFKARRSLWEFQKITAPQDYKEERTYLLILALCLQSFYQDKPVTYDSYLKVKEHQTLDLSDGNIEIKHTPVKGGSRFTVDLSGVDILIIEIPPRHHKSHSLIIFEDWVFGQDPKHIMITAAHNADLANEFSSYVRDGIEENRMSPMDIIYSDVFPNTKTKFGDRSKKRWSLEGSFLSYAGAGIFTPVTGKGGKLAIFDDPVKGPLEAFNEAHLDKLWSSLTNGWLSRLEKPRKQIHVMTPWVINDPGDRTVKGAKESGEVVKVLNMKAHSAIQGMLCDDILDERAFNILKARLDPVIFSGNYLSKRIASIGRMYPYFRTYQMEDLPQVFEEWFCYVDTADEGSDFLDAGLAGITTSEDDNGLEYREAHMIDVYDTQDGMEITEPGLAEFLARNYREEKDRIGKARITVDVKIESNNGGRGFARNVERLLEENHPDEAEYIFIEWFHQSENKQARINSESNTVMKYIVMPHDWEYRWPSYHDKMTRHSKLGKNSFDDHADMTTGIAEHINVEKNIIDFFTR
ncbi:hypothetical protein KAT92_05215 [Candidatus Babeliales bacterium]|nr:hypothetical protein [Candidatus Babeliales bacterium]